MIEGKDVREWCVWSSAVTTLVLVVMLAGMNGCSGIGFLAMGASGLVLFIGAAPHGPVWARTVSAVAAVMIGILYLVATGLTAMVGK